MTPVCKANSGTHKRDAVANEERLNKALSLGGGFGRLLGRRAFGGAFIQRESMDLIISRCSECQNKSAMDEVKIV